MKSLIFFTTLCILTHQCFNTNAQVIHFEHKANQLEGITDISLKEGTLSFESDSRREGFIVIESDAPLILKSSSNAKAALSAGWDGTLGYKLYGVRFQVEEHGSGEVRLQIIEPPVQAIPTTSEEIEQFKKQLDARPSKFPGGRADFQSWQRRYLDSLAGTLMGGGLPDKVPGDIVIELESEHENFRLISISYQSLPDRRNKALLSLPKNMEKVPLLVALHGHETSWGMADSAAFRMGHIDDFCAYFANRGWAVLQPATMNHQLQHKGWTCLIMECQGKPSA